jgi:hypothetical protein
MRSYSEDDGANVVLEAGGAYSLLVSFRSTSLISEDKAGTNPDSGGAQHQSSGEGVAVEQTTSSDNLHVLASHGALLALAQLGNSRDEDGGRNIARVTTTLTTLSADDVGTSVEGLLNMLGVTDHVHIKDTSLVKFFHDVLGRNTDSGNEELGAFRNDDINQLVKLALGVVVASKSLSAS